MKQTNNQTSVNKDSDSPVFPVAAIVCLSVGGYVILVIIFLVVRRMVVSRGSCHSVRLCHENGTCCSICVKIKEACPSCCSCIDMRECWAKISGAQQRLSCRHIFCCCGVCTDPCCDSCTSGNPNFLCCCSCHSSRCFDSKCSCPSCFDDELDPNACGCLCFEIKLRSSQCGIARKNTLGSSMESQNQHFTSHELPNKDVGCDNDNLYQPTGELNGDATNKQIEHLQTGVGSIRARQRSSSHSPSKTVPHHYKMSSNKSDNSDILSVSAQVRHTHPDDKSHTHVNIQAALEELYARNVNPHLMPSSTIVTSSSSGDSTKDFASKSLLDKSTNTESSAGNSGRSTLRSGRSIRPGQMSQRFPNKILVSSESLKLSKENTITVMPGVSFSQSPDISIPHKSTHYVTETRRPLPSLRKT